MNGQEALRRLKSAERTRTVPVVVLTASQEERDLVESYQLGANSYVCKPVNFEQFPQAMGHLGIYWLHLNRPLIPQETYLP